MKFHLLAAGLVLTGAASASAQDEKVLGRDDILFAQQLMGKGYPDLAERLLTVIKKSPGRNAEATAQIGVIELEVEQDAAGKLDDLIKRKDALITVLGKKEKFVESAKGTDAAENVRNTLPDLYNQIGETLTAAIKKETDNKKLDNLRAEGDALFVKAEQNLKARIATMKELSAPTPEDLLKLEIASYNYCRTIYFHALLFAPGSPKRLELVDQALGEYDTFDMDFNNDDPSIFIYYADIDAGYCMKELGKPEEANKQFDKVIALRESFGEKTAKGQWPIPVANREVIDLVCYGTQQKMIVLRDQKKWAEVIELGKDYVASMPGAMDAQQAPYLLKELCEAQIAAGDKGAADTAKRMIDEDKDNGLMAAYGRELRDRIGGGSVPFADRLRSAQNKIDSNDIDRGLAICHQIIFDMTGTPDEQKANSQALLLIGYAYQKRGWFDEGAVAYQAVVDRYPKDPKDPKSETAAEALGRVMDCYRSANRLLRRQYYKDRIDGAMKQMRRDYPNSPLAVSGVSGEAKEAMDEGDFLKAIELYKTIPTSSTDYTKSRLMIGICYFNHAMKKAEERRLAIEKNPEEAKKPDEAKSVYPQAEQAFKDAIQAIRNHPSTMDTKVLSAYEEQEYLSILSLVKLYMLEAYSHFQDAVPWIDELEKKWGKDARKGSEIQNLRGRLFLVQGKFEEAAAWVDDLYKRDKIAAAGPAGQLARALDTMGQEKRTAKPGSIEADDLWKRAAKYYYISIKPQVDGAVSQDATEMTQVGNRLYVYGLTFNGVPAGRVNFVDWKPTGKKLPEYWTKAAEIYKAALEQTPDYRMAINLARTYGFLERWVDSTSIYSKLFEQEQILNPKDKRKLDSTVTKAKSDLVVGYMEWGVAERMAAQPAPTGDGDKGRLGRARDVIFVPLKNTLRADAQADLYWPTLYHLVRTMIDRGEYNDAQLQIDDLQRQISPTFDEDKYGYKTLFEATIAELKPLLRK